jgi:hypothetical protein
MTAMPHQNPDTSRYALVITEDGQLVNNTVHTTRAERRYACVEALKETRADVPKNEVLDILLSYGGADPDAAIGSISALYAEFGVDIYLEDQATEEDDNPLGLPLLHSVFIDYGEAENAANSIVHFTDATKRADHLRQRLINLHTAAELSLTEAELALRLQETLRALINDQVTVHLLSTDSII